LPSAIKKQEQLRNSEMAKKYSQKISELTAPEKLQTALTLAQQFPATGEPHTSWYFGRFGKTEIQQNSNLEASEKYQEARQKIGAQYLDHNKKFRISNEILQARKTEADQIASELPDSRRSRRPRAKSIDYLATMKKQRESSQDGAGTPKSRSSHFRIRSNTLDVSKAMGLGFYGTQAGIVGNEDETNFIIDRFRNFDRMAKLEEQKIRMMNPVVRRRGEALGGAGGFGGSCYSNSPCKERRRVDQQATTDTLDDYYLKAIKAKLGFLDDLKSK
jgi:hypothetical protein